MTFLFQNQSNLPKLLSQVEDFADIVLTEEGIQVKVYSGEDEDTVKGLVGELKIEV